MRRHELLGTFLLLPVLLLGAGCGVGGGEDSDVAVTLVGDAALDGYATNGGAASTAGGPPLTGDLPGAVCLRQFFSFSLAALPPGAHVESATLRLVQVGVAGIPYFDHGAVVVDHLNYGPTLTGADFGAAALSAGLGPIAGDPSLGARALDVTAQVIADLAAGRTRSQFRTRFSPVELDLDLIPDYVLFADAELSAGAAGDEPRLFVTYRP